MQEFQGCTEEMYRFFWEIAFQNNAAFFEANRERYQRVVKAPMFALARDLLPEALAIDPDFDQRIPVIVSRIRRDTRFTRDKSPYRDHVWLGFKYAGRHTSECFTMYVYFDREEYGYGMGMYAPDAAMMTEIRERMKARPDHFLSLVQNPAFTERFVMTGEHYHKPRFTGSDSLTPWLNLKSVSFLHTSKDIEKTTHPEIEDELKEGLALMKPVFRFLKGLE